MKRGPGPRRTGGPKRTAGPRCRPAAPVPGRAQAAALFRNEVLRDPCVACGSWGPRECHHALPARWLKDYARYDLGMTDVEALALLYAPELAVPLCDETQPNRCHQRHTLRHTVVPGSALPERVHAFVADLGPAALEALRREHP